MLMSTCLEILNTFLVKCSVKVTICSCTSCESAVEQKKMLFINNLSMIKLHLHVIMGLYILQCKKKINTVGFVLAIMKRKLSVLFTFKGYKRMYICIYIYIYLSAYYRI